MQRRDILLHEHLNELDQGRNQQDENDGLQIIDPQRLQDAGINDRAEDRRQRDNENDCAAHSDGGVLLLRNADEGAEAQESGKNDVVDQRAGHKKQ